MKKKQSALSAALSVLLLAGCGQASFFQRDSYTAPPSQVNEMEFVSSLPDRLPPELRLVSLSAGNAAASTGTSRLGNGTLTYAGGVKSLTSQQEQLLLDYMHSYFMSLSRLEVQDITGLFHSDYRKLARQEMDVWEVEVEIRKLQKTDLSLRKYAFALTVTSVTPDAETGYLNIRLNENNSQRFTAYPGVDAETFQLGHNFTLIPSGNQWKLRQHRQFSGANNVLSGRRYGQSTASYDPIRKADYLAQAKKDTSRKNTQGVDPGNMTADHPYQREAAVAYALEWVGKRNTAWRTYDRMGGNCQNFTSQAIHAGGIPMDISAPGQWKWYGDTPNASYTASGRASSWTGVNDFLTYVNTNQGYGMVAKSNVPFYSGEPGDIIHMGTSSGYRHTVIISQVMTDKDGNVVDYLVCSNTADLKNYPVSAYHYTNQMLIKIYGWNNG